LIVKVDVEQMSSTLPLSISVIAKNEERNLHRCLKSLGEIAREIVLVYNDCTDDTVEVAESFGARCIEHPWTGFVEQKNFALSQCSQEWILCLDADEALSDKLRESIINFLSLAGEDMSCSGASFNRCSYFLGKWIKHGDWYPDKKVRLLRHGKGVWVGNNPHDKLKLDSRSAFLKGDLQHFSYECLRDIPEKALHYSDVFLQTHATSSAKASCLAAFARPLWRFFRAYLLRFGFLDGYAGFVIAFSTAYETMLKHGRLWELNQLKITNYKKK
jgi:glycosyltransferase involved in cell wall biosynthesis